MEIGTTDQRTAEWFAARCGRVTASRVADVMARTKSGPSASRANYAAQLVCERLTGTVEAGFTTVAMQRGTELEPVARDCYSFETGLEVIETGFIVHPTIEMAGASPDGLIGTDGLVEIKVPGTAKHIASLTGASIDGGYIKQMQWQMACTGRQWCDFVSYSDQLPLEMQLHIRRVERDDELIAEMEREIAAFLDEVSATVAQLRAKFLQKEAA